MRYLPINKTGEEILKYLGFIDHENKGFIMKRMCDFKDAPCQIHALVREGWIETHEDYLVNGKHESSKKTGFATRLDRFRELYEQVDNGIHPTIGKKLKKHYHFFGKDHKRNKSLIIHGGKTLSEGAKKLLLGSNNKT